MSTSSDELGGLSIFELSGRSDGRASCRALTPSLSRCAVVVAPPRRPLMSSCSRAKRKSSWTGQERQMRSASAALFADRSVPAFAPPLTCQGKKMSG